MFGSFTWWHINLRGLFNVKVIIVMAQNWGAMKVHISPKGINSKVNVIAWLKFELAYYDKAVYHVSHYTTETLPVCASVSKCWCHHNKVELITRIPLTCSLSLSLSLSHTQTHTHSHTHAHTHTPSLSSIALGRSSRLHPVSVQIFPGQQTLARL